MSWAAIGAAGVGVAGGIMANNMGGQETSSSTGPWAPGWASDDLKWLRERSGDREYYPGQTYANFDPTQQQGFDMTLGAADDIGGMNKGLMDSQNMFMGDDFMDPNANPYMSQYVDAALRPLDQRYSEQIMPGIRSNARATGGADYGSTRQGVSEGIATRGYNDAVGDVTAGIYTDLYGKNIDAKQRAMSMSPMVASMMGTPAQMYQGVGGVYQGQDQLGINDMVNAYNYNRDRPYDDRMSTLQLQQGMGGTTTTTGPAPNPWTTGIGTGLTAYGMMNPGGSSGDSWESWNAWDDQYDDDFAGDWYGE